MKCNECGCNVFVNLNSGRHCYCGNCGIPINCSDYVGRKRSEEIDWGDQSKRHKFRVSTKQRGKNDE